MNNYYIEEVNINNFRGYRKANFNFFKDQEDKSGVILLAGANGFGKTTLIDAIEWCLTGTVKHLLSKINSRLTSDEKKNQSLQNGLIKNINSTGCVKVQLVGTFKSCPFTITRSFEVEKYEIKGLSVENTKVDISIQEDVLNEFSELLESFQGNYNDKYICSFEKNIELYEKGRNDIYQLFSSFFGSNSELETTVKNMEKIIKNTEERKEDINKKNEKLQNELKLLNDQLKEEMKDYGEVSGYIDKLNEYPDDKVYKYELTIKELNELTDKKTILSRILNQIEILENIKKIPLTEKVKDFIKYLKIKQKNKIFEDEFMVEYKSKKKLIFIAKKSDLQHLNQQKLKFTRMNEICRELKSAWNVRLFLNNLILKSNYYKEKFPDEVNSLIHYYENLKEDQIELNMLLKIKKSYKSNNEVIKALRSLVDNIEGFNVYRKEGFNTCPLCGSKETFYNTNIAEEAKKVLGKEDKKRAELKRDLNNLNKKVTYSISEVKDIVRKIIKSILEEIEERNNAIKKSQKVKELCKFFDLEFKELSDDVINNYMKKLTTKKAEYEDIKQLESKIIEGLSKENVLCIESQLFKQRKATKKEYEDWTIEQKITSLNEFICENEKLLENVEILIEDISINDANIEKRVNLLQKQEKFIDGNERISKLQKKINEAKKMLQKNESKLKLLESKRNGLKKLETELKNIKSNREKKMVDDIIDPVQKIYQRITRHTNFKDIFLKRAGTVSEKSELRVKDFYGEDVFMANVLSAGQLSTLGISLFLATASKNKDDLFRCYFMDDPIQSMDDLNILSFVDLLRIELNKNITENSRYIDQLFISTCDEDLEKLIEHKMRNFSVNFCKYKFKGYEK